MKQFLKSICILKVGVYSIIFIFTSTPDAGMYKNVK